MIVAEMLQPLVKQHVEVWIRGGRSDGPTFDGKLEHVTVDGSGVDIILDDEDDLKRQLDVAPVRYFTLLDDRGISVRVVAEHVIAVVSRG